MTRTFLILFGIIIFVMGCLVGVKAWCSEASTRKDEGKTAETVAQAVQSQNIPSEPYAFKIVWRTVSSDITTTSSGSCFAISTTQILTARHCLYSGDKRQLCRVVVNAIEYPCEVLKEDANLDLALCEVKGVILKPEKIRPTDAAIEQVVMFVGFPRGIFATNLGAVKQNYYKGTVRSLALVKFDHGFSGGPVMASSAIVGMAVSGVPKNGDLDHSIGLFIPASVLLWFLKE